MKCPSKLALASVTVYAVVATFALFKRYVQDISSRLVPMNQLEEQLLYEEHFVPSSRNKNAAASFAGSVGNVRSSEKFPIKTHIVTQGKPRTATTLLFNMVAVSYFLYLVENDRGKIPEVELSYWQRPKGYKILRRQNTPIIIAKAHIDLDNFLSDNTVFFTAVEDKKEAEETRRKLEREGYSIAFVQNMETVKNDGLGELVQKYVVGYGLTENDEANLNEYFEKWQILRQCCGQQMSAKWRNDMMPKRYKDPRYTKSHPTCAGYDIDSVEQSFMNTELYALIEKYPNIKPLNKPSMNDATLNGTYCCSCTKNKNSSSYNNLVRTQGLNIWGQPGGRPKRSNLDGAVKDQIKQGRKYLKPEAYSLFPSSDQPLSERLRAMWKRPEKEKKEWLKAVLAAREDGGKSYSDYRIESTTASADATDADGKTVEGGHKEGGGDRGGYDMTHRGNIGQPGARLKRNNIDGAIQDQMKQGRKNLKREAYSLFPSSDLPMSARLRRMWRLPEKEKKEWLKAVLAAREASGKIYSDYRIHPTAASADATDTHDNDVRKPAHALNARITGRAKDHHREGGGDRNVARHNHGGRESVVRGRHRDERNNAADMIATTDGFDDSRAIFLISFGQEAAESTLVERCILSLRRRGAWDGYVIVLTDASPERYQEVWDDNVIVMHPLQEHMKAADGTTFEFTKENMSLKSKRFKTFIVDYMGRDKRLDSVETVYYLDIDILAGGSMSDLFTEIERKYKVSRQERSGGRSKLYFFTPLSKEW
ncbi:hypothetical protein ACHAWF_003720 [Thalassiosira exigua]